MKTMKYLWTLCLALAAFSFAACSDDDNGGSSATMKINQIYLENVDDEVNKDRPVEFARLGQLLRIEGSGFSGLKRIYVNGYETYFNNALMTDNNVWVTLNAATPVEKADVSVRNTIVFYKNDDNKLTYEFTILAAAPSITSVDNTLPKAGETVTVYGANLQETTKATLPDGTEITSGIRNDEDGKWYSFTVPGTADLTKSGSITSEGANGTAKTPTYFNDFGNFITDFDGKGELGSWSATYGTDDLVDDPLNSGRGKVALLAPLSVLDAGGLDAGGNAKYWATAGNDNANDDWSRMYGTIPAETKASEVAIQFDIYCPEPWDLTGQLEISLQNNLANYGWGSAATKYSDEYTNTATVWIPWLNEKDGSHAPFTTGERWQTITIPMTAFGNYDPEKAADVTFQKIVEDRNSGSYKNLVLFLVNSDLEFSDAIKYKASTFNQKIYVDNLRVVSTKSIAVKDFNDGETATE